MEERTVKQHSKQWEARGLTIIKHPREDKYLLRPRSLSLWLMLKADDVIQYDIQGFMSAQVSIGSCILVA